MAEKTEEVVDLADGDNWTAYHGDSSEVLRGIPDDSVHLSVYSPPFASIFVYSPSERDLGNVRSEKEFHEHYSFIIRELYRVTMPGRLSSVHAMVLPTSKVRDGVIGLSDFPGQIIRAHQDAGWIYHSKVTIWKDPVVAAQRTKALGLLYKQLLKDSCMSRMGIPDEVMTFRKPGENPERVSHKNPDGDPLAGVPADLFSDDKPPDYFPLDLWQKWASPVWDDINQSDTLMFESAREHDDERHLCCLQLEVIRRCLRLWSNPGDIVLSPFMGVGSEGHVALQEGRKFVGIELKRSYFEEAVRNLASAVTKQQSVF